MALITAHVHLGPGRDVEGEVSNLTTSTLFLHVSEALTFQQEIRIALLGASIRATVAFVSEQPPGAVLSFEAGEETRAKIEGHLASQENDRGPWEESTAIDGDESGEDASEETVEEMPVPVTADSGEIRVLSIDSASRDASDLLPHPAGDDLEGPADILTDGIGGEIPVLVDPAEDLEPDNPHSEDTFSEAMLGAEELVSDTMSTTAHEVPDPNALPFLDSDGVSVRFGSREQYQVQFQSNIENGGLEVQSKPFPIGTQKMLALIVPGSDKYVVSARVIFSGNNRLGFMIDSFNIHRQRLKALTNS